MVVVLVIGAVVVLFVFRRGSRRRARTGADVVQLLGGAKEYEGPSWPKQHRWW